MNTDLRYYIKYTPAVRDGGIYDLVILQNMADFATHTGLLDLPPVPQIAEECCCSERKVREIIAKYLSDEHKYIKLVKKGGGRGNRSLYRFNVKKFIKDSAGNRKAAQERFDDPDDTYPEPDHIEEKAADKEVESSKTAKINSAQRAQFAEDTMHGVHSLDEQTMHSVHSLDDPENSMPYIENIINSRSSSKLKEPKSRAQFSPASSATYELPFDPVTDPANGPVIPKLEECDWSFLNTKDRKHLPTIKAIYKQYDGDLGAAGYAAFAKHPGGWNSMRMTSVCLIKDERGHEQAFAAVVIAGKTGTKSIEDVLPYFNGTKTAASGNREYATHEDILNWRRASSKGRPAESYLEFRVGVSVNAHGEYYANGRTIDIKEALRAINHGLTPSPRQREEIASRNKRTGGLKQRKDLGKGVSVDEKGQYFASGRAVDEGYAKKLLSL